MVKRELPMEPGGKKPIAFHFILLLSDGPGVPQVEDI